ncbi:MAG: hypothetical protein Q8P22_06400 [Chloroflexota bacterium]|nr:hypothetical protein [Chloroflexota bacterium]
MPTHPKNLEGLARLNAQWVQKGMARATRRRIILDMDNSKSPVYGER